MTKSHTYQAIGQQEYEIQKIIDEGKIDNQTHYLVKWKGYPHSQNTWEPYKHLKKAPEKIKQWKSKRSRPKHTIASRNGRNQAENQALISPKDTLKTKIIDKSSNLSRIKGQPQMSRQKSGLTNTKSVSKNSQKTWQQAQQQFQTEQTIHNVKKKIETNSNNTKDEIKRSYPSKRETLVTIYESQVKHSDLKVNDQKDSKNCEKPNRKNLSKIKRFQGKQSKQSQKEVTKTQITVIQILSSSDSQQAQLMSVINQQQEMIIEESISYSSNKQLMDILQHDQSFLMNKIPRTGTQKQLQEKGRIKKKDVFSQVSSRQRQPPLRQFHGQSAFLEPRLFVEEQLMQKFLNCQNPKNIFDSPTCRKQINQVNYEFLEEMVQIYKENETVYCVLTDKNGLTVQKITYQSIQTIRPDLITSFFNGKVPGK